MTYMDRRRSVAALSKYRLYKVGDDVPTIVADFKRRKYLLSGEFVSFDDMFTHTRSSSATYNDANGNFVTMGSNVPRVGHHVWDGSRYVDRGLLMEGQRVNGVTNNTMQGAVVGALDSGGALPTGWHFQGINAQDVEVVGTGNDGGIDYIDIRFWGMPTNNVVVFFEGSTAFAVTESDDCNISAFVAVTGGDTTNIDATQLGVVGHDGAGAYVSGSGSQTAFSAGGSLSKFSHSGAPVGAAVVHGRPFVQLKWTSGEIDVTLRVGLPQIEKSTVATSPIKTGGAASTRAPDLLTMTNLSGLDGGFWVVLPKVCLDGVDGPYDRVVQLDDGDGDNRSAIYYSAGSQSIGIAQYKNGEAHAARLRSYSLGDTTKIAVRFGPGKFAVVWEDGTIYEDSDCDYAIPDRMHLAASSASGISKPASMSLAGIMLHPPTITPAQMAAHLGGLS